MLLITEGITISPYVYPGLVETIDHVPQDNEVIYARLQDILDIVSRYSGLSTYQIQSRLRHRDKTEARFIFWALCRKYTSCTLRQLCSMSGSRDHSTVLHGISMFEDLISQKQNSDFINLHEQCERHLRLYFSDVKRD